jgi:GntR family transcriptional repressor for pyruvate dehydrogenase complex
MERKRAELVRQLTMMIREPGRFPGGQLPAERELAASLGVGRNLLRESIITLEAMGLLEIRERQGTFIIVPDTGDLMASLRTLSMWPDEVLGHLMEMRLIIEVPAAGLAAERRTADELARMRECLYRLERTRQTTQQDGLEDEAAAWDTQLHGLVLKAAHNPILDRVHEGLSAAMARHVTISRKILLSLADWPAKVLAEHQALVGAITAGDSLAARAAMHRHLAGALQQLGELRTSTF